MTHTEKVHIIFGLMAACIGFFALWGTAVPGSRARLVWPALTFLVGFFLFIPVEAQTRTYQPVGWGATLLSAVPDNAEYWLDNWFRYLRERHVLQHKVGGLLIMAAGIIEYARARGRLQRGRWEAALPVLLLGIGIAFGVHGGSAEHLPNLTEQRHHQVFGLLFAAAAVTLGLARTKHLRRPAWHLVWAVLVLVVGLDIALLYRLTPAERAIGGHHHASTGSGMR